MSQTNRHAHLRRQHRLQQALVAVATVLAVVVLVGAVAVSGGPGVTAPGADAVAIETPDPAAGVATSPEFAPVAPSPPGTPTPTPPAPTSRPTPSPSPSPTPPRPSPTPVEQPSAASPTAGPSPDVPSPKIPSVQAPTNRGMLHVPPVRIEIPDVGIASDLVDLQLNPGGSLQVPKDYDLAGWYADGPYPGDATSPPAVIVGHVDSTTGPAVFFRLRELVEGDEIRVTRQDGSVAVFRVRNAVQYPKTDLPTDEVYRTRAPSELVLITCSGDFDSEANSYLDNFVVTARLDRDASGLGT